MINTKPKTSADNSIQKIISKEFINQLNASIWAIATPQPMPHQTPWDRLPLPSSLEKLGQLDHIQKLSLTLSKIEAWNDLIKEFIEGKESAGYIADKLISGLTKFPLWPQFVETVGGDQEMIKGRLMRAFENFAFSERNGVILESTEGLDEWLEQTDIGHDISNTQFRAPFPAVYIHFGKPMKLSTDEDDVVEFKGAYILSREIESYQIDWSDEHEVARARRWGLAEGDKVICYDIGFVDYMFAYGQIVPIGSLISALIKQDDSRSLVTTIREAMTEYWSDDEAVILTEKLNRIAKVLLYCGVNGVRMERINELSQARAQMNALGPKKRAKAERQTQRLYDRVVVGPDKTPAMQTSEHSNSGITPHWRRGHFRNQVHGPRNTLRKIVFVEPVIVRKDLLDGEQQPKNYILK